MDKYDTITKMAVCNHGCGYYCDEEQRYIGTTAFRNGKCETCFDAHQKAMDNVMTTGRF
tara:strand:- start:178 stop:354 length:177 start_codon:yes stop_codon:yes gene_type:complete